MQRIPICFGCTEPITDPIQLVFDSPCGHGECASATFHGLCLMDFKENREKFHKQINDAMQEFMRIMEEFIEEN